MSDMVKISIEGVEHILTIEEAQRVLSSLSADIQRAELERAKARASSVQLDAKGRFGKLQLRKFFLEAYPDSDPAAIATKSGKLFNKLCKLAEREPGSIVVTHAVEDCGRRIHQPCLVPPFRPHKRHDVTKDMIGVYLIEGRSLFRNPLIVNDYSRYVGDVTVGDFELLLKHIEV